MEAILLGKMITLEKAMLSVLDGVQLFLVDTMKSRSVCSELALLLKKGGGNLLSKLIWILSFPLFGDCHRGLTDPHDSNLEGLLL